MWRCEQKASCHFGTTNADRIDLALKMWSCDGIIPKHCLTSQKIVAEL